MGLVVLPLTFILVSCIFVCLLAGCLITFMVFSKINVSINVIYLEWAIIFVRKPLTYILVSIVFYLFTFSMFLIFLKLTFVGVAISRSQLTLTRAQFIFLLTFKLVSIGHDLNATALLWIFEPLTNVNIPINVSILTLTMSLVIKPAAFILWFIWVNMKKVPFFAFIIIIYRGFFNFFIFISIFSSIRIVIGPFAYILVAI